MPRLLPTSTLVALLVVFQSFAQKYITPVADGSIANWPDASVTIVTNSRLHVDRIRTGVLEFRNFQSQSYRSIRLSLNLYGLPVYTPSVRVYGYDYADGLITANDAQRGRYLGRLLLPEDLGFGEETFFDVTRFVHSVRGNRFGLALKSDDDTAEFSSLEMNYGTPPHLVATRWPDFTRRGRRLGRREVPGLTRPSAFSAPRSDPSSRPPDHRRSLRLQTPSARPQAGSMGADDKGSSLPSPL
jgi:hypothetical protein